MRWFKILEKSKGMFGRVYPVPGVFLVGVSNLQKCRGTSIEVVPNLAEDFGKVFAERPPVFFDTYPTEINPLD